MGQENTLAPMEAYLNKVFGKEWRKYQGQWQLLLILDLYRQFEDVPTIAALFDMTEKDLHERIFGADGTGKWDVTLNFLWSLYLHSEIQHTLLHQMRWSCDPQNKNPDRTARAAAALAGIEPGSKRVPVKPETELDGTDLDDLDAVTEQMKKAVDG